MCADKLDMTVVVLTYNEERHIARCIGSAATFARRVLVVDSFSTDRTIDIARQHGARIYQNKWLNYAAQFQWALENGGITTEWIMRLDADEVVEPNLEHALRAAVSTPTGEASGFYVRRKYIFLGKWIRHGGMYPIHVLRVWRAGHARIERRWMDEHMVLLRGHAEYLDGDIRDDNLNPVSWWVEKHNGYATREMIDIVNQQYRFLSSDGQIRRQPGYSQAKSKRVVKEKIYNRLPLFVRPLFYFLYRYLIKLGFLDGSTGFAFHFMQGFWYRTLVDLKVLEAKRWLRDCTTNEERRAILAEKTGLNL
jgi:glycosyltransferase involved in cell wall biosynthesis